MWVCIQYIQVCGNGWIDVSVNNVCVGVNSCRYVCVGLWVHGVCVWVGMWVCLGGYVGMYGCIGYGHECVGVG